MRLEPGLGDHLGCAVSVASGSVDLPGLLAQARPPLPREPRPIVVLGAGGIVRAAHLPAYRKAGFPVASVADAVPGKAADLARDFGGAQAFDSVAEAVCNAPKSAVFDVAVPAALLRDVVRQLPDGATVLLQKPFGETLDEAAELRELCRSKGLIAAANFQLRYAPNHLGAIAMAQAGLLGEVHEIEVQVRTWTPWHLWSFLATAPRLEILYHSIHYLDLLRAWLGNPRGVKAITTRSPISPGLAAVRSDMLLDYGDTIRVVVSTSHGHRVAATQAAWVQWQGMRGVVRMEMGAILDYPEGRADTLAYAATNDEPEAMKALPMGGNWFPDAFIGSMGALQAFAEGSAATLPTNFESAFETMALVEAAYRSAEQAGEPLPLV